MIGRLKRLRKKMKEEHGYHQTFKSISTWFREFSPSTQVSPSSKIVSQSNPTSCGAVLRGHTWVVFRGRTPSQQHSFFGPTLLSCALRHSVYDCEKGRLASQILLLQNDNDDIDEMPNRWYCARSLLSLMPGGSASG